MESKRFCPPFPENVRMAAWEKFLDRSQKFKCDRKVRTITLDEDSWKRDKL